MDTPAAPIPRRPRAVTIASTCWVIVGLAFALVAFASLTPSYGLRHQVVRAGTAPEIVAIMMALGVAVAILGYRVGRGSTRARAAVTVIGLPTIFTLLPGLLVIPAIVLQFVPIANAWFAAVSRLEEERQ